MPTQSKTQQGKAPQNTQPLNKVLQGKLQQEKQHSKGQQAGTPQDLYYSCSCDFPRLGTVTLYSHNDRLVALTMPSQQYVLPAVSNKGVPHLKEIPFNEGLKRPEFKAGFDWLTAYIEGKRPDYLPPYELEGTDFRKKVWRHLLTIPYGELTTYGDIAKAVYESDETRGMQARAIGGAVGHNPLPIMIPCHRVVGSHKHLTGYTGGLDVKKTLLSIEGINLEEYKD